MKRFFQYLNDICACVGSAFLSVFDPIADWVEQETTLCSLRNQFSAVTAPKYADALCPVINKISDGIFWIKRDLWIAAIGMASHGTNAVDILLKFDHAAYCEGSSVTDLLFNFQER